MTKAPSKAPFRAGYIAVLGLPNAGKSTLLNEILDEKLSIVSRRPQTTRRSVLGIHNQPGSQMIFIDTPGILDPDTQLQKNMMGYVKTAIEDADVILYLVDVSQRKLDPEIISSHLDKVKKPVILGLNKIDLVKRQLLLPLIADLAALHPFKAVVPISALKNDGIDLVVKEMAALLPESPPYYPTDQLSDQQTRFFVAEIIREKIFTLFSQEIPYATHIDIEEYKERANGKDYIRAAIIVEKKSQKGIIIGKGGEALKRASKWAREEIERFVDKEVYLELHVKVVADWRKKSSQLKQMGY